MSSSELLNRHRVAHALVEQRAASGALSGKEASTLTGVAVGLNATHGRREIREIARRASHSLGFYDELWQEPDSAFTFQWQGLQQLEAVLATGRGAVLVSAHFGPYRWLAPELLKRGFRLTLLVDEAFQRVLEHDVKSRVHKVYSSLSHDRFSTVNSGSTNALWQLARALKQGRVVLSFADGNSGTEGKAGENGCLQLPFLGQVIRARPGIAALAQVSGAALLPVEAYDNGSEARFEVRPALEPMSGESRLAFRERGTRALFAWLEEQITRRPAQWEEWWLLPSWLAGKMRVSCERTPRPDYRVTLPGLTRARLALPDNTLWSMADGANLHSLDLATGIRDTEPLGTSLLRACENNELAREWLDAQIDTAAARRVLEQEIQRGRVVLQRQSSSKESRLNHV